MSEYPPPGPELDALVAEKVMGLEVSWWSLHPHPDPDEWHEVLLPDDKGDMPTRQVGGPGGRTVSPYSTSIAAAWEVVEKFVSHGCAAWVEGDGHTGYRAGCTSQRGRFEAEGETAPHAICLAALKAVETQP